MLAEQIDKQLALIYMGARGRDASELMPLVDECADRLAEAVFPRYIYRLFPISRTPEGIAVEGTGLVLRGSSIADHLEGCESCVLLCATLSAGADTLIRQLSAYDMASSFVTDCLASAAVETVCDEAEREMAERLPDKFMTWRFSPGYGDLPLESQWRILSVLDAPKRIGLNVTESMMLVPSKSVTAVIGVSDREVSREKRGCTGCAMYKDCTFRKGGGHCGI
ncbi:MAG: methionine synthase [Ruminococcus sp.]|nr:methionine synthase [Ruminococcus sp.]